MLEQIWTAFLLGLLGVSLGAWGVLVCRAKGIHPICDVVGFFKRQTKMGKVLLGLFLLVMWVFASTKPEGESAAEDGDGGTNGVNQVATEVMGALMTSEYSGDRLEVLTGVASVSFADDTQEETVAEITSTNTTETLDAKDFERKFVLARIGTDEEMSFGPPTNAVICSDWKTFGAATDWIYLTIDDDWAFTLGTNTINRFRVSSFGKVEPFVRDETDTYFAPMEAELGIAPECNWPFLQKSPSQFWYSISPSNTLQLTWQNVLLGREVTNPVSFQVELWPQGKFVYHYDLSHLGDEIHIGGIQASVNGHTWSTNALSHTVTSLSFHPINDTDRDNLDPDGDGLATIDEIYVYDTNPWCADSDEDGLSDYDEVMMGSDPWALDTDGEGLTDFEEVQIGTNPLIIDSDVDGIDDWEEIYVYGTNPTAADSDEDGLHDLAEINGTTNPLKADTDDDGLNDGEELSRGTNPNNPDTDGDGANDGWEVENGANCFDSDTDGDGLGDGLEKVLGSSPVLDDSDGDGFSDYEEFTLLGTSPIKVDTDSDGLSDWDEVDWIKVCPSNSWVKIDSDTRMLIFAAKGNISIDEATYTTNLPSIVTLRGIGYDRISIDTNGKVHLVPTNGWPLIRSNVENKKVLTVDGDNLIIAPYWDDLVLWENLASSISMGTCSSNGNIVINYENLAYRASSNLILTCQVVLSDDTNFPIRINYKNCSTNMTGQSATIGVFDRRIKSYKNPSCCHSLIWSYNKEGAITNGLSLGFRIGTGTNPINADTDYDGLNDGDEFINGTDPLDSDTDNDGLEDGIEIEKGSNPLLVDTDNDGMPDAWEVRYGLNPCLANDAYWDNDHDDLSNLQEYQFGSSPIVTDTDSDGLSDYVEYNSGSSPANKDTDGDGLDDAKERQLKTSATNSDTDGDGMDDEWEYSHGLNPLVADATYDLDRDGLTNIEEYALGTHPRRKDTDGDGIDDGDEVGYWRRWTSADAVWASETNGWTAVRLGSDFDYINEDYWDDDCDPWPIYYHTPDLNDEDLEDLRIGSDWVGEIWCQWNGVILINPSDFVYLEPVDLSATITNADSNGLNGASLIIAPYWTECLNTNNVSTNDAPIVQIYKSGTNGNVRYAIQYEQLPAGGTNVVSFQATLIFTNGFYRGTEILYGSDIANTSHGLNASIGIRDNANKKNYSLTFKQVNALLSDRYIYEFVSGTGTDPTRIDSEIDSDRDGLTDEQEKNIGTNPYEPDTDGDGLYDGWEYSHGFNPRVNNNNTRVDKDETNDSDADPDGDGLTNQEEVMWGTDPFSTDSDGDGVLDKQEIENLSDPNDSTDGGVSVSRIPVSFNFGDPSGSHSEKYRLMISPLQNVNSSQSSTDETPKSFEWINAEYGECETKTAMLQKGWIYEVRMAHAGSNADTPDYDYRLVYIAPSSIGIVTNDPSGLFQEDDGTSDYFSGENKVAQILILDGGLVGDYNHKDGFTKEDLACAHLNKPLRHWINNDNDAQGQEVNEDDEDVPNRECPTLGFIGEEPDYYNDYVDGLCDILDFAPIWIDMGRTLQQLTTFYPGTQSSDYVLTLAQPENAINVVWTSLTTNTVDQFLTTRVTGCGESLSETLETATTASLSEEEIVLPDAFVSAMQNDPSKGVILIEGRNTVSQSPLILRCYRRPFQAEESLPIFEVSIPLSISPVEDMYRWIDERNICGDANGYTSRINSPSNNPDSECDNRHFVFVHGYNVSKESARGWAAEMFKRLWQSGSQSMFTAVDWRGDQGQITHQWIPFVGGEAPNYYTNVVNAFKTAPQFATDCANLPGQKIILAHSLGNMLVSSAAKDHGLNYSLYYMLNAAVPMEAYDSDASNPEMIDADWRDLPERVYSANWWRLFPIEDGRRSLTWSGRFSGIHDVINCYSTTEDTLGNLKMDDSLLDRLWDKKFWGAQELNKGTKKQKVLPESWGHSEGGWGFNPDLGSTEILLWSPTDKLKKRIETLTPLDLIADPIFRPFDEEFLTLRGALSTNMVNDIQSRILANGIPAISFATGANSLSEDCVSRNINYLQYMKNGFPSGKETWEHSDIKNFSFFYNYNVYEQFLK